MKHYFVYVLYSLSHDRLYVGKTSDVVKRLDEHNRGRVKSTAPFRPYELIYYEAYLNKTDAGKQESYLKSGSGRELTKKKLTNYFNAL